MVENLIESNLGYLPFTRENRKFQLEDQMVRAILFGQLQKIWALICGDATFLLFQVSLADIARIFLRFPLPQRRI